VLSALVVKSELMVTSTAVGAGETTMDDGVVSSPDEIVLSVEDDKGSDENDDVGVSKLTPVTVAPTLIPADIMSVWLIVEPVSTEIPAEISSVVGSAVATGRSVLAVVWGDETIRKSLVDVDTISEMDKGTSEIVGERYSGVAKSDAVSGAEETGGVSNALPGEMLLGSKASLLRLETLRSADVSVVIDTVSITSVVGRGDSTLSSPETVLWEVEVIWTELSIVSVGSISGVDTSSKLKVSLTEVVMLGIPIAATGVELKSDTNKVVDSVL
jgi:hypothetical protein